MGIRRVIVLVVDCPNLSDIEGQKKRLIFDSRLCFRFEVMLLIRVDHESIAFIVLLLLIHRREEC